MIINNQSTNTKFTNTKIKNTENKNKPEDRFEKSNEDTFKLTILHTNDLHGHIDFELHQLAKAIKKEKKLDPEHTLVLDGGDISTGNPVNDYFHSMPVVETMNVIGYDAMVIGNHDLDDGRQAFKELAKKADFDILGANLIDKTPGEELKVKPYTIKQMGNVKIGILGLTSAEGNDSLNKEDKKNMSINSAIETAKDMIPKMKDEGADIIIILSHLGVEEDKKLAQNVEGINCIVGAHSHTEIKEPLIVNETVIGQTGLFGKNLGKMELDIKHGKIVTGKTNLISLNQSGPVFDKEVSEVLSKYFIDAKPFMERVIGKSNIIIQHVGDNIESQLANVLADAVKEEGNADFGILAPPPKGSEIGPDIKVGELYELFPWKNRLSVIDIKGDDIKNALEEFLSGPAKGFAISGMKIKMNSGYQNGNRIESILLPDGRKLEGNKIYRVATADFYAKGGFGIASFKKALNKDDTGILLQDVCVNNIEKKGIINPPFEKRIIPAFEYNWQDTGGANSDYYYGNISGC